MGGVLSYLMSWVSAPAADDQHPDPATGLTERDRQLISDSWSLVSDKKSIKQNGVELFVQLFRTHPHMQNYFKSFKGLSESELRSSVRLRAHSLGVMNMFTSYIDNLTEADTLVALIQKMATSHYERKIFEQDFEKLAAMLPSYLKSVLGNQLTEEAGRSWMKLLTTHNAVVAQTMEAARADSKPT